MWPASVAYSINTQTENHRVYSLEFADPPTDMTTVSDALATVVIDPRYRAELARRDCWIFDLDGTLTRAVHDFDDIRARLGVPAGLPILEYIDTVAPDEATRLHEALYAIELELARDAKPQPGARVLLERLRERGRRLGIVTRNSETLAHVTLAACGMDDLFDPACVLGRERCAPKPDPAGVLALMAHWCVSGDNVFMVGDYLFDLEAGRGAGAMTIHYDARGEASWTEYCDFAVSGFDSLLAHV